MRSVSPHQLQLRAPSTLLDLLRVTDERVDLPVLTRRVLKSGVRAAGRVAAFAVAFKEGRTIPNLREDMLLHTLPAKPEFLNNHLFACTPTLAGVSEKSFALGVSGLRSVMRHSGLLDPYVVSTDIPLDSAWRSLLDQLLDKYCQTALSSFAVWADRQGLAPSEVSSESFQAFERHTRSRTLHREIPRLLGGIRKAWPKAAALLGSDRVLVAPSRRYRYTIPLCSFPQSFQTDVEVFRAKLVGSGSSGPFREEHSQPLRLSTIQCRIYGIQQAASALVHGGRDIDSIVSLANLVEIDSAKEILKFFWDRKQDGVVAKKLPDVKVVSHVRGNTAQTGAVGATLTKVARYCGLSRTDPEAFGHLRSLVRDVTPKQQQQLSSKNRARLRQLDNPVIRAKLLHLPSRLRQLADGGQFRPVEAARLARLAVAIEFLLHIPLRNNNLSALKLGVHLRYDHTGRVRHLVLQAHETKNHLDVEWPIGSELAGMLDWYIAHHRPLLNVGGGDCLFPAGFGKYGSLSNSAMYQHMVRVVAEQVGMVINPHLFRCICALFILERSPEAIEDVRLMIGDKSLQVVLAHYNASQPKHAAARTDATIQNLRAQTAPYIRASKSYRSKRAA